MSVICPTVTCQSDDIHEYRRQMEKVEFADRIQVDLMDGIFTPTQSPNINSIWFFEDKITDLHLMYQNPADVLDRVIELKPNLLIVHAEADFHLPTLSGAIKSSDIGFGVALLSGTPVEKIADSLDYIDHVLIFSGDLGRFGGEANLDLLSKVTQLKSIKPTLEIGWDGGVNDTNVRLLRDGLIDVINVGGYIQNADSPKDNYYNLLNLIQS